MFFASNLKFSVFAFSLNQSKQKEKPLANVFFTLRSHPTIYGQRN